MDRNLLNNYKKQKDKLLLSKIIDKVIFCEKTNKIQTTNFLDLAQKSLIEDFLKKQKINNYMFFGGYEEKERTILIIYPENKKELIENKNIDFNEFIKVIRIALPKEQKEKYEHRNYLRSFNETRNKKRKNRRYISR